MSLPNLIVADGMGNFIRVPELSMAGMNFIRPVAPSKDLLIPLPPVTQLMVLPGRVAMGYDEDLNKFVQVREYQGKPVYPVAAVLPKNYLQLLRPAYSTLLDAPRLPPNPYSAVGINDGEFTASGGLASHDPSLEQNFLLLNHLTDSRERTIDRAVSHLNNSANGAVRFFTENRSHAQLIANMIVDIRKSSDRGFIQIDSNAATSEIASIWCEAGMDRIRIWVNSAQENFYNRFYAQHGFTFPDLQETLAVVAKSKREAELAYLIFPGLTDHPDELSAFTTLIKTSKPTQIVLDNLRTDPDWYMDELRLFHLSRNQIGIPGWVKNVKKAHPDIYIGEI